MGFQLSASRGTALSSRSEKIRYSPDCPSDGEGALVVDHDRVEVAARGLQARCGRSRPAMASFCGVSPPEAGPSPRSAGAREESHQRQRHADDRAAADELPPADVAGAILVDEVVLELAPLRANRIDLSLNLILAQNPSSPRYPRNRQPRYPRSYERVNAAQPNANPGANTTRAMTRPNIVEPTTIPAAPSSPRAASTWTEAGATATDRWRSPTRPPARGSARSSPRRPSTRGPPSRPPTQRSRHGRRSRPTSAPRRCGAPTRWCSSARPSWHAR